MPCTWFGVSWERQPGVGGVGGVLTQILGMGRGSYSKRYSTPKRTNHFEKLPQNELTKFEKLLQNELTAFEQLSYNDLTASKHDPKTN